MQGKPAPIARSTKEVKSPAWKREPGSPAEIFEEAVEDGPLHVDR